MYTPSAAYIAELNNSRIHRASLQISLATHYWDEVQEQWVSDSYTLTEANVVEGSLNIEAQAGDSGSQTWGSIYAKAMSCALVNLPNGLQYSHLKGARLTVNAGLIINNTPTYIPMGVYVIDTVEWTNEGINIDAYDQMSKFDFPVDKTELASHPHGEYPYTWALLACQKCNMTLGNTEAEFIGFLDNHGQNYLLRFNTENMGDVVTWRDFLFRLAQTVGCFCTLDRSNLLQFIPYTGIGTSTVSTIELDADDSVLDSARVSDFIARYSGFWIENADGSRLYYGHNQEDCLSMVDSYNRAIAQAEKDIEDATDMVGTLTIELHAQEEAYAAGRITEQEFYTQYQAITAQINTNEQIITERGHDLDDYAAQIDIYEDRIDPRYDGMPAFDFGYNPFLSELPIWNGSGWAPQQYDGIRWIIAGCVNDFVSTPFAFTAVGNWGYDLGDRGTLTIQGQELPIFVQAWACDMYTQTVEGFGSLTVAQNAASQSTNSAQGAIAALGTQVKEVKAETASVSKKVSDGKVTLASAITDMGIPTDASASYRQMATNIRSIHQGELTADDILVDLLPMVGTVNAVDIKSERVSYSDAPLTLPADSTSVVDGGLSISSSGWLTSGYYADEENRHRDAVMYAVRKLRSLILASGLQRKDQNGEHDTWEYIYPSWSFTNIYESFGTYSINEELDPCSFYLTIRANSFGQVYLGITTNICADGNTVYVLQPSTPIGLTWVDHRGYIDPEQTQYRFWCDYILSWSVLTNSDCYLFNIYGAPPCSLTTAGIGTIVFRDEIEDRSEKAIFWSSGNLLLIYTKKRGIFSLSHMAHNSLVMDSSQEYILDFPSTLGQAYSIGNQGARYNIYNISDALYPDMLDCASHDAIMNEPAGSRFVFGVHGSCVTFFTERIAFRY